jgi:hypothetical protein
MNSKTERLGLRILPSDKQALEQIAIIEGEAMAVVVRNLIRRRARELGVDTNSQQEGPEQSRRHRAGS